jgi:hypothetical protein
LSKIAVLEHSLKSSTGITLWIEYHIHEDGRIDYNHLDWRITLITSLRQHLAMDIDNANFARDVFWKNNTFVVPPRYVDVELRSICRHVLAALGSANSVYRCIYAIATGKS